MCALYSAFEVMNLVVVTLPLRSTDEISAMRLDDVMETKRCSCVVLAYLIISRCVNMFLQVVVGTYPNISMRDMFTSSCPIVHQTAFLYTVISFEITSFVR